MVENKEKYIYILLTRNNNLSFLQRIFTGDDKWVLHHNRKPKRQWIISRNERLIILALCLMEHERSYCNMGDPQCRCQYQ